MKEHVVFIVGGIGDQVTLINVVASVNAAPPDTQALRFKIESPGGVVEVGDNIYDFINSLKPKYRIITEQIGFIGSIATKIFGVGDEREAMKGEEMGIHNPWTIMEGDADAMDAASKGLRDAEKSLTDFYIGLTGLTEEAIAPLMSATTFFDAETAVKLRFATRIKDNLKIAASMKNKKTSAFGKFVDSLYALLNEADPVKPQNMVLELEDGTKIAVAVEDASKLEGAEAYTVGEDGNPTQVSAPDGELKLKDGRTITIEKGVIKTVVAAPAPEEDEPKEDEAVLNEKLDKLADLMKNYKSVTKEEVASIVDEKITALRAEIKVTHTPAGFDPSTSAQDAEKWNQLFKENKLNALKKDNWEEYCRLHFARWKKMPN